MRYYNSNDDCAAYSRVRMRCMMLDQRHQSMNRCNYLVTRIHKITSLKVINKLGHHYKVVREHLFWAEQ